MALLARRDFHEENTGFDTFPADRPRKVSVGDTLQIATIKGLTAGGTNLALGLLLTGPLPSLPHVAGALIAMLLFGERPGPGFWTAAGLMAIGVWLLLTERHEHEHTHEPPAHAHRHIHDGHHQHEHDFAWDGSEPHVHFHGHAPLVQRHPHYPDIHHQH